MKIEYKCKTRRMRKFRHFKWCIAVNKNDKFHAFIHSKEYEVELVSYQEKEWISKNSKKILTTVTRWGLPKGVSVNQYRKKCIDNIKLRLKNRLELKPYGSYINVTYTTDNYGTD